MPNTDWDPSLYLKFERERTQPVIDLVTRLTCVLDGKKPERIIDIGCGPGNSTSVLRDHWPESRITGLDNSPAMIDKARESGTKADWLCADAHTAELDGPFNLIFSNAAYQWMPNQTELFHRLRGFIAKGGIMAAQIPLFMEMPMSHIISEVALNTRWDFTSDRERYMIYSREEYYEILSSMFEHVDLWVTSYIHIMDSPEMILEMMKSTALKPYLSQLEGGEQADYEREILEGIKKAYPSRGNGKILFPFKRLFFIAK